MKVTCERSYLAQALGVAGRAVSSRNSLPILTHVLLQTEDDRIKLSATDLDLHAVNPGCRVYVLPCIAGHVGADCAGVVLSETPWLNEEITLLVDVGTNAEIVLGNKDKLLACSSPTGPAFEGAQIGNGQRAAPGAIERVRIDKDTLEPRPDTGPRCGDYHGPPCASPPRATAQQRTNNFWSGRLPVRSRQHWPSGQRVALVNRLAGTSRSPCSKRRRKPPACKARA